MNNCKYKSILELTGVKLPNAITAFRQKLKKTVLIEEQFQVAYIMYHLEKRPYTQIARMLTMTVAKVKKILSSYICKMMVLHNWQPMYLCRDKAVYKEEAELTFEYAELAEITSRLHDYEKSLKGKAV